MCDEILIISKGKLIAYDTAENPEKMMAPKASIEVLTDASLEECQKVLGLVEGIEEIEYTTEEEGLVKFLIHTTPQKELGIRKVLSLKFAKENRAVLKLDIVKANLEEIFIELTNPEEGHSQEDISEEEEENNTDPTREEEAL